MNNHTYPLSKEICDEINPILYPFLTSLNKATKVLDVDSFKEGQGFKPDIATIFVVTDGGSFDCDKYSTLNGTLIRYMGYCPYKESAKYQEILRSRRNDN